MQPSNAFPVSVVPAEKNVELSVWKQFCRCIEDQLYSKRFHCYGTLFKSFDRICFAKPHPDHLLCVCRWFFGGNRKKN